MIIKKINFKNNRNFKEHGAYTFLSTLNFKKYYNFVNSEKIFVYPDGITMIFLLLLKKQKIYKKYNFDFSGIADDIINSIPNSNKIVFCGGTENDINNFKKMFFEIYFNRLKSNTLFFNGYDDLNKLEKIHFEDDDVLILSLGCPLQEKTSLKYLSKYPFIRIFTCGAFISQTSNSILKKGKYYPKYIEALNLRFIYRAIKEKNHYKRLTGAFMDFLFIYRRI